MQNFSQIANKTLNFIVDTIEDQDQDSNIDIDFTSDVINITTDFGVFVINKHSASREIWLSSPISGPCRFFYSDDGVWVSRKNQQLFQILQKELSINFQE